MSVAESATLSFEEHTAGGAGEIDAGRSKPGELAPEHPVTRERVRA
jgi:hypothetical protein